MCCSLFLRFFRVDFFFFLLDGCRVEAGGVSLAPDSTGLSPLGASWGSDCSAPILSRGCLRRTTGRGDGSAPLGLASISLSDGTASTWADGRASALLAIGRRPLCESACTGSVCPLPLRVASATTRPTGVVTAVGVDVTLATGTTFAVERRGVYRSRASSPIAIHDVLCPIGCARFCHTFARGFRISSVCAEITGL